MNRPEYISFEDWDLLNKKYSSKELEKYFHQNYPYQYLIGDVEFCNCKILVDERVLIPRYETETLVYKTIKYMKQLNFIQPKVVDLCTGSGCIAIALQKNVDCKVDAVDISEEALFLAKENANNNKVEINFICNNILDDKTIQTYDVVISNPPYISKKEKVGISTKFEPQIALFAEKDGLQFYETILQKYKASFYAFEIGCTQKNEITSIVKKYYPQAKVVCEKDFAQLDRYIFIINE